MINVKKIKPMFTMLITTADTYDHDVYEKGILVTSKGTLKDVQTVVARGRLVSEEIQVGSKVMIDPKRFAVNKRDKNSLANDLEGGNQVLRYQFDFVEMDHKPYMKLQDRDVDYVIEEFEEEPDEAPPTIQINEPKIII